MTAATIVIGGNFKGNISGMTVNTAACVVTIRSVGFNKNIVIGADAGVTLAAIHVRSAGSGTITIASGAAGVITLLSVGRTGKQIIIQGSGIVTTFRCAGAPCQIEAAATAFTTAAFRTGTHDLYRSVTTFSALGPSCTVKTYNSVALTTATVAGGASLLHDSDGTIGTLNCEPGGSLVPVATKFVVTDSVIWEGSTPNKSSDMITFTNASSYVGDPD